MGCLLGRGLSLGLIQHKLYRPLLRGTGPLYALVWLQSPSGGGGAPDGEILQIPDSLDKEEEQLKKARSFGLKRGASIIPLGVTVGGGVGSTQSPAPTAMVTSQPPTSSTGGGGGGGCLGTNHNNKKKKKKPM